nr:hypothetical protein [Streptomyces canus]
MGAGGRWVYDGCHDPVLAAQLPALIEGRAEAQAQSTSDTPDREVTPLCRQSRGTTLRLHRVLRPAPENSPSRATGHVAGCWNLPDGTLARGLFGTLHTGLCTWVTA